jgi:putative transposase
VCRTRRLIGNNLGSICEDETGTAKNEAHPDNLDLHRWTFDQFPSMLDYKAEADGITVTNKSEQNTSKIYQYVERRLATSASNGYTSMMSVR